MGAGGQSDKAKDNNYDIDTLRNVFKPPITPYVPGGVGGEDFPGYDNEFEEE